MIMALVPMYTTLKTELYREWKFQNRSKYRVTKTARYSSCVLSEIPAHDLVAWIFSSSTRMDIKCSRSAETLKIFILARSKCRAAKRASARDFPPTCRHRSVKQTYDKDHDTFRYLFLVAPCALTALVINQKFTIFEILWAFSIYLEAVAILPQLVLLQRTKNVDNLTGNYVFLLGMYRTFYILNWIYRYITEPHYSAWIVWVSGLVQTALYLDFFYYYLDAWKQSKKLQLPS